MTPDTKTFLDEIWSVCEKYGKVLSHEDGQGAFIIEKMDPTEKVETYDCTQPEFFKGWLFSAIDNIHPDEREKEMEEENRKWNEQRVKEKDEELQRVASFHPELPRIPRTFKEVSDGKSI